MVKYKVRLKKDTCIGCGMCASICPNVFEMGSSKSNLVGLEYTEEGVQEKDVNEEDYKMVKEVAKSCPTSSIEVYEEEE